MCGVCVQIEGLHIQTAEQVTSCTATMSQCKGSMYIEHHRASKRPMGTQISRDVSRYGFKRMCTHIVQRREVYIEPCPYSGLLRQVQKICTHKNVERGSSTRHRAFLTRSTCSVTNHMITIIKGMQARSTNYLY